MYAQMHMHSTYVHNYYIHIYVHLHASSCKHIMTYNISIVQNLTCKLSIVLLASSTSLLSVSTSLLDSFSRRASSVSFSCCKLSASSRAPTSCLQRSFQKQGEFFHQSSLLVNLCLCVLCGDCLSSDEWSNFNNYSIHNR